MPDRAVRIVSQEEMAAQRALLDSVSRHPNKPATYHIVTFGCQMNVHDSEKLSGMLCEMGIAPSPTREEADFVLFNTCCIRDNAERKALGNITWLKEIKRVRPHMLIGVCGCMMQQQGMAEKILAQYPFVDIAFGTGNFYRLGEFLLEAIDTGSRVVRVSDDDSTLFEDIPISRMADHKAYVAIMHGCNNYCTYCIVPYVRGRERSRKADNIIREVACLQQSGVKEITLLGQNVNSFGTDTGDTTFPELLRRLEGTGISRIRFMTSHPKDLSDALIEEMARNKAICPHMHLPVQSGSDRILRAMNRRYTAEDYLRKVHLLRQARPDIGLTTDFIVAFPGETEADFEDTLSLARSVRYDSAFTFIFSPRAGTRAAVLPGRIDPDVATDRIERLIAEQEATTADILAGMKGVCAKVLVDGVSRRRSTQLTGKSERNLSVNFTGDKSLVGSIVPVIIEGAGSNTLRGKMKGDAT